MEAYSNFITLKYPVLILGVDHLMLVCTNLHFSTWSCFIKHCCKSKHADSECIIFLSFSF